jgi:cytochrome c oxidase subunit 2
MKATLTAILMIIVATALAACSQEAAAPATQAAAPSAEAAPAAEEPPTAAPEAAEEQAAAPSGDVTEIAVTAGDWTWTPSTITVKKGDRVRLMLKSLDVDHGFSLKEYGIDEFLGAGKEATVEFTADKAGEFEFSCSVYCGTGHRSMRGKLVVE